MLYGTTRLGGTNAVGTVFRLNKDGGGYQRLYSFRNSGGDGNDPYYGSLAEGSDGALYGTTYVGGSAAFGTVYRLTRDGASYSVLRHFGTSANDARHPWGLFRAPDGFLYGTCSDGGGTNVNGVLFKLSISGLSYSVLHSFGSPSGDGLNPCPGLVWATDGMLYGSCLTAATNPGTIFRLNNDGTGYNALHKFGIVANDARNPAASLALASDSLL